MSDRKAAFDLLDSGAKFLVSCHRRPDADALGSAIAFSLLLEQLGKQVTLFVPDDIPSTLRFIPGQERIIRTMPKGPFDATWVMDTAAHSLLPAGLSPDRKVTGPLIVVDHHAAHDDVGDIVLRDVQACATAEVVLDMWQELDARIDKRAATPLYAAIVADTGGFRYPVTRAKTLRMGADLLDLGAKAWDVAYELFEGWEPARMHLLSGVLESLTLHMDGRVALLRITRDLLSRFGADDDMVEGLVNYGRMLRGVEVAALLWEFPVDDTIEIKVSLRSSGNADVSKIAVAIGGGGHSGAAGAQLKCDIDAAESRILAAALKLLH